MFSLLFYFSFTDFKKCTKTFFPIENSFECSTFNVISVIFLCVKHKCKVTKLPALCCILCFGVEVWLFFVAWETNVATDVAHFAPMPHPLAWNVLFLMHCTFSMYIASKVQTCFNSCGLCLLWAILFHNSHLFANPLLPQFPQLTTPQRGDSTTWSRMQPELNSLGSVESVEKKKLSRHTAFTTGTSYYKSWPASLPIVQLCHLERLSCCHNNVLCHSTENMLRGEIRVAGPWWEPRVYFYPAPWTTQRKTLAETKAMMSATTCCS